MNYQNFNKSSIPVLDIVEAFRIKLNLNIPESDLRYFAWPEMFGTTVGPFKGIGGCALSEYTIEAFVYGVYAIVFCNGNILFASENFEPNYFKMKDKLECRTSVS